MRPLTSPLFLPFAAGAIASLVYAGVDTDQAPARAPVADTFTCSPAWVHDGDTFACADGTRIRVAGVNAREIGWDGRRNTDAGCNPGAPCPTVDAVAARDRLASLLGRPAGVDVNGNMRVAGPPLTCEPNGTTYNRIAAFCRTPAGVDISCAIVASGAAARWEKFWSNRACPR